MFLEWLTKHAWTVLLICAGAAIGLLLKYPANWNPPDAMQNVLGGLVGAVGSVAAAFLVLKKQMSDAGKRAADERHYRVDRERAELESLRRAVAPALIVDLKTVFAILETMKGLFPPLHGIRMPDRRTLLRSCSSALSECAEL
jgi:hypothetical protein